MSELNAEYVESVIKLGIIEYKKQLLTSIGDSVMSDQVDDYIKQQIEHLESAEALLRNSKRLRVIAELIVKASPK